MLYVLTSWRPPYPQVFAPIVAAQPGAGGAAPADAGRAGDFAFQQWAAPELPAFDRADVSDPAFVTDYVSSIYQYYRTVEVRPVFRALMCRATVVRNRDKCAGVGGRSGTAPPLLSNLHCWQRLGAAAGAASRPKRPP